MQTAGARQTAVQQSEGVVCGAHAQDLAVNGHLGCVQEAAGEDIRLVRVMPNTPCLVGETASAMCLGGKASEEDAEEVRTLFSSVGRIVQVPVFPTSCLNADLCGSIDHDAPTPAMLRLGRAVAAGSGLES